jgi:hypothetical protein
LFYIDRYPSGGGGGRGDNVATTAVILCHHGTACPTRHHKRQHRYHRYQQQEATEATAAAAGLGLVWIIVLGFLILVHVVLFLALAGVVRSGQSLFLFQ